MIFSQSCTSQALSLEKIAVNSQALSLEKMPCNSLPGLAVPISGWEAQSVRIGVYNSIGFRKGIETGKLLSMQLFTETATRETGQREDSLPMSPGALVC